MQLIERFSDGDRRALARAITWVENGAPEAFTVLRAVYPLTGKSHIIGITGPPGAGKSTLVDKLAAHLRNTGKTVAIVAVDPSSPFSGGAILGDRIRMQHSLTDAGIFMRSLATRGHLGGMSLATGDVVTLLDAFGFDVILVETVGAGQSEVDIMELAHTTIVVMVPGMGDDVQAIKAGILEIGDLFTVNKADRDGANRTVSELEMMLDLGHMGEPGINRWPAQGTGVRGQSSGLQRLIARADPTGHHDHGSSLLEGAVRGGGGPLSGEGGAARTARYGTAAPGDTSWRPPVLRTVAKDNQGVADLAMRAAQHLEFLQQTGRWKTRQRQDALAKLRELVSTRAARRVLQSAQSAGDMERLRTQVADRLLDPYSAADEILGRHYGTVVGDD